MNKENTLNQDSHHPQLLVVAIDGPVASGKTVVGRKLAERLNWQMLDTGIMYRALTWIALVTKTPITDPAALTALAERANICVGPPGIQSGETASISVDELDATPHLRERAVEANVSTVAAVPGVREQMVGQQRAIAKQGELVMVGRDIGTVVVPDAAIKIYLDASPQVRASRRAAEMRTTGNSVTDIEVLEDLRRRDALDAGRATSPLRAADRAEWIDTSELELVDVVELVLRYVREKIEIRTSK